MTDVTPRTPLTLEYSPEPIEGDEDSVPVLVVEPSVQHDGRIFVAVHPFGRRIGLHLLPEDALRLRNHLSKLLIEPEAESEGAVDWQERIEAAAKRAQTPPRRKGGLVPAVRAWIDERTKRPARRRRGKRFLFRTEFQIGDIQGVIGRLRD